MRPTKWFNLMLVILLVVMPLRTAFVQAGQPGNPEVIDDAAQVTRAVHYAGHKHVVTQARQHTGQTCSHERICRACGLCTHCAAVVGLCQFLEQFVHVAITDTSSRLTTEITFPPPDEPPRLSPGRSKWTRSSVVSGIRTADDTNIYFSYQGENYV